MPEEPEAAKQVSFANFSATPPAPLPSFAAVNALGDARFVRDAFAHLARRFPDLVAEPVVDAAPSSGWGLVNDGAGALLGSLHPTRLEDGLDRMIALARAARPSTVVTP